MVLFARLHKDVRSTEHKEQLSYEIFRCKKRFYLSGVFKVAMTNADCIRTDRRIYDTKKPKCGFFVSAIRISPHYSTNFYYFIFSKSFAVFPLSSSTSRYTFTIPTFSLYIFLNIPYECIIMFPFLDRYHVITVSLNFSAYF